ncbi:MAG: transglycosylase SLT domain-containing protein [Oligoflexus sp.]
MDRWLNSRSISLWVLGINLLSCQTPPEPSPIQDMTIVPMPSPVESPAAEKLKRLQAVIEGHPQWQESATPLLTGLQAQKELDERQWDLAQRGWLQILKTESGQLGDWAFGRWLETYQQILKANASPDVLAKILLAETDGGAASPFLQARKLTEPAALASRIAAQLGMAVPISGDVGLLDAPPATPGRPSDDPLLAKTSQNYCLSSQPQAWRSWIRTLNPLELRFWQVMVAVCRGDERTQKNILPDLAENLRRSKEFGLAVEASHRLVDLYRAIGSREDAANAYMLLVEALNQQKLTAKHLNLEEFAFQHYHANQVLWGSRYRAMIGDYLTARDWVQRAFKIIDNAYRQDLQESERRKLEELRAEGYHILAFRISYEQQDFEAALIQNRLASRITPLNEEWRFRLAWYEAWYQYRAGRIQEANKQWQLVLEQFPKYQDVDRVLFWLSLTSLQSDQKRVARQWFDRLCEEFPLSFYTMVAPRLAKIDSLSCQRSTNLLSAARSSGPTRLRKNVEPTDMRRDDDLAPLLYRAELAIRADLGDLRAKTVEDLHQKLRSKTRVNQDFSSYLYMSRLLYAAQDFHRAIGIAYELSLVEPKVWNDFPDQLHIFFPKPYMNIYERNAARFYVDTGVLLAITRRESTFRAAVKSPAGAIGLMQLMPATAETYATKIGQNLSGPISSALSDPETNIRLGTAYLGELSRMYKGNLPHMLAAYNAGEYVVDRWIDKRAADLPLVWVEGIPFGETQGYVKNVMRNLEVYRQLSLTASKQ